MGFHPLNPANEEEQEFLVTPNGDTPIVESEYRVFYDTCTKVLAITRSI